MLTELPGLSFAEISNTLRMNFHTVKLKGKDTGNTIDCLSVSDKEDTPHHHIDWQISVHVMLRLLSL